MVIYKITKSEKIIQALCSGIERLARLFWIVAGALIVLMAFVTGYGVFTRYILRNPDQYSFEIDSILMVACVVFSVAYTQKCGGHLRVDILDKFLSKTLRGILINIFSPLVGLTFCSVLFWKTWEAALNALQNSEITQSAWTIPTFPIRMLIPVGIGLLCLVLIAQIIRYLFLTDRKNLSIKE